MNRIFRTLWSATRQCWQAVPENTKTAGKGSSKTTSASSSTGAVASFALGFLFASNVNAQSPPAVKTLPTGGVVAQGAATISQTSTAQAAAPAKNITLTVAPQDVACAGEGAMRCLSVKMGKDTAWSNFYSPIEGFTFTPGVQYKLLVRATPVANPPADGSNTHYALVRVLWRKLAQ